jgi:hypothetical protein
LEGILPKRRRAMVYFNLDLGPIIAMVKGFDKAVHKAMNDAARDLTAQTHAHILEEVQAKLHSTRQKYVDALSYKQVDTDTWVIELGKEAMFIEEGIKPNTDMLDALLKSPKAKTAKDGSRYIVVPFEHKKGSTSQTPAQSTLTNTIKSEMKKRKIPYGKLETGADGKPKTGLLHSFDIMKQPIKTAPGAGSGHGPIGQVKQGPTGIPHLQGVRVYQTKVKDKQGKESVKKSIMTFRVASSKMKGQGRWVHPGLEAKKFLDEAAEWALKEFEGRIRDQILIRVVVGI